MSVDLGKCGRMVTKRGKVVRTKGIALPEGDIAEIEDSYKYLGIPQQMGTTKTPLGKLQPTK